MMCVHVRNVEKLAGVRLSYVSAALHNVNPKPSSSLRIHV